MIINLDFLVIGILLSLVYTITCTSALNDKINKQKERLNDLEINFEEGKSFVRNSFNTLAINHDDLKNMFIKHKHIKQIEEVPTTIKKKVEVEKVTW